ncbi:MAG: aspartate/glutamate racemase family protein [Calditrichota bacterium]
MKTIGLVGGMDWESSAEYYRIINEAVRQKLGKRHSAKCVMYSVDFEELELLEAHAKWKETATFLTQAIRYLVKGGAEFFILCNSHMHYVADEIQTAVDIPFLHIADATAAQIKYQNILRVGLIGSRFIMEEKFYRGRLEEQHHLEVLIPRVEARNRIHRVIYEEILGGSIRSSSKAEYLWIINELVAVGAQGLILGAPEINLLISPRDVSIPVFDSTLLHARAAVDYALNRVMEV